VPISVRIEKLAGKLRHVAVPVVLAGKDHLATDLALTPEPAISAPEANAMLIRVGKWTDHLRYAIHFTTPGDYQVWLLGQSGGSAGSDELKIFFDRAPDPRSDHFFEMRFDAAPGWIGRATARKPENRKTPVQPVVRVDKPGWHTLFIAKGSEPEHHSPEPPPTYRFPNWRLDKIVLARDPGFIPLGDGPAETRSGDAPTQPAAYAKYDSKIFERATSVQLNVENILQAEKIIGNFSATSVSTYRIKTPTVARLTLDYAF